MRLFLFSEAGLWRIPGSYKLEGSTFTAERTMLMRERELPATRTGDYLAFRRAVVADLGQRLSIENTTAGTPAPPPGMKATNWMKVPAPRWQNGNFPLAVQMLKRAVEVEPKHKYLEQSRTRLPGHAQMMMLSRVPEGGGRDPYDEFAFNNLGRAYWQQRKYEDATTAFHRQLEINPLEQICPYQPGRNVRRVAQYDEAAPEWRKPYLSRPTTRLQSAWANAYLNLGRTTRRWLPLTMQSISRRHRGVEQHRLPASLKNAHLDKASNTAESACTTAAALRNLSLDQLNQRDLALVVADCLLGHAGLGLLRGRKISTRRRNTCRLPGNWGSTARSAITWTDL